VTRKRWQAEKKCISSINFFCSASRRPVYEEPPTEQREKLYAQERAMLKANMTNPDVLNDSQYDIPLFNALCRGEEYRVRTCMRVG